MMNLRGLPADIRFWSKVDGGDVSECWEWTGHTFAKGYGQFRPGPVEGSPTRAHRWAFERLIAPIPEGLQLDHLCENPPCVNPWHLDPVSDEVHRQRGTQRRHARSENGRLAA